MPNTPENICAACGAGERRNDPLLPEEFYPDVRFHLHCLSSPEAWRWRNERMAQDPGFKRYMDLITMGRQVSCPSCGSRDNYLSQKSAGFSPSFELCCTQCDQFSHGLSPYEHPVTGPLSDLQQDFVRGLNLDKIDAEVERRSREQASRIEPERCSCGGSFVIAARPRCHQCRSVLADTYFHYNGTAPPPPDRRSIANR